jgi:hypothetical protein
MNASPLPDAGRAPASRALHALDLLQRVETLLAPYLEEFTAAEPGLRLHRRTYGGAWVIGLRTPGGLGDPGFARIEFEVSVDAGDDSISVAARSTTHNRDHVVQRMTVRDGEVGMLWLSRFLETALLMFAGRYHGPAQLATR